MNHQAALQWFTGKSRERAQEALLLLYESKTLGQWVPGASRKVKAALNKCNVAHKLGHELESTLRGMQDPKGKDDDDNRADGFYLWLALSYGNYYRLLNVDMGGLWKLAKTKEQKDAVARAGEWVHDFLPLAKLTSWLDTTRPAPVFTSIGVSPTITKTLQDARLRLDVSTVRLCPRETFFIERTDPKTGHKYREAWIRLLWPKGTVFEAGRFNARRGTGIYQQCESCGHGISNPFNWVPLLIDNAKGVPHALWVGRDCAQRIYGVKIKGDVRIVGVSDAKGKA